MARKQWSQLSDVYRRRLERHGITPTDYASGRSLASARGHGSTPERPGVGKERAEFSNYYQIRRDVTEAKRQLYGRVGKASIREMSGKSTATLRKALAELQDMIDQHMNEDMLSLRAQYPELEDTDWDWLFHYH